MIQPLKNKIIRVLFFIFLSLFALIGLFFTGTFIAVRFHVTNDPGAVDYNDRYFQEIKDKYNQSFKLDSTTIQLKENDIFHKLLILNKYCPKNAEFILNAYMASKDIRETERMIEAVELYMQKNTDYVAEIKQYKAQKEEKKNTKIKGSIFDWMNISEWTDFKYAVAKDKLVIDSVAKIAGVEPRMIVAILVGEQIRLFNSQREEIKKWVGPLKILTVETSFSLGVTGIKEFTAQRTEQYLKDTASPFYTGKKYEHLLDYTRRDSIAGQRYNRLSAAKNHFYSYLYAALIIRQIKSQWQKAGYPIDRRPEILATLFNIGYDASKPKPNPEVGGAKILINDKNYTFGLIAYEFYYSGELFDLFPFKSKKFD